MFYCPNIRNFGGKNVIFLVLEFGSFSLFSMFFSSFHNPYTLLLIRKEQYEHRKVQKQLHNPKKAQHKIGSKIEFKAKQVLNEGPGTPLHHSCLDNLQRSALRTPKFANQAIGCISRKNPLYRPTRRLAQKNPSQGDKGTQESSKTAQKLVFQAPNGPKSRTPKSAK